MTAGRSRPAQPVDVDGETPRNVIKNEYKEVAEHPDKGFHFHTGRRLAQLVGSGGGIDSLIGARMRDPANGGWCRWAVERNGWAATLRRTLRYGVAAHAHFI